MVDLITSGEASRLLRVDPRTLRKYESPDGQWCMVFGDRYRFRVFHYGGGLRAARRYDRNELVRILNRMERSS
jgi:hypothetical protein